MTTSSVEMTGRKMVEGDLVERMILSICPMVPGRRKVVVVRSSQNMNIAERRILSIVMHCTAALRGRKQRVDIFTLGRVGAYWALHCV